MTEEGEFILQEPYATMLQEARAASSKAWTEALVSYLEERSPYTTEELVAALLYRNEHRSDGKVALFEEFVLEALGGDL